MAPLPYVNRLYDHRRVCSVTPDTKPSYIGYDSICCNTLFTPTATPTPSSGPANSMIDPSGASGASPIDIVKECIHGPARLQGLTLTLTLTLSMTLTLALNLTLTDFKEVEVA